MPRRSARAAESFGSHNRGWIWGRNVVLETLRSARWRPLLVLLSPKCGDDIRREVERSAETQNFDLQEATDDLIVKRCRAAEHQGLAASMPAFPYASLDELLERRPLPSTWLVLDRVQDSYNFGAILRAAHGLGVEAVVIGTAEQSDVNSQAVRSSAGAASHMDVARIDDLVNAVGRLIDRGIAIVAAAERATDALDQVDLTRPVAVVIGNEGRGIQPDLLRACTARVRIPLSGRVGSLNAAVAAGIFCYEIARQRRLGSGEPT
jgi:23S rRNA (guanosine2251-2'-O)-methyltransferase